MQDHIGSPAFKLVARNSRNNSPFFRSDSNNNTPRPKTPPMNNPKQERDREGERKYIVSKLNRPDHVDAQM